MDLSNGLDPMDSAGRSAVKEAFRDETPSLVNDIIKTVRPSTGPREGSVGSANMSNTKVNTMSSYFRVAGPALVGASLMYDAYDVATSSSPCRTLMQNSFAILGSLGGGALGVTVGTFVEPGVGTVVGGLVGAGAGGHYGRSLGDKAFNVFFGVSAQF